MSLLNAEVDLARRLSEKALADVIKHVLACPSALRCYCVGAIARALVDLSVLHLEEMADPYCLQRSIRESLRQDAAVWAELRAALTQHKAPPSEGGGT